VIQGGHWPVPRLSIIIPPSASTQPQPLPKPSPSRATQLANKEERKAKRSGYCGCDRPFVWDMWSKLFLAGNWTHIFRARVSARAFTYIVAGLDSSRYVPSNLRFNLCATLKLQKVRLLLPDILASPKTGLDLPLSTEVRKSSTGKYSH